MGAGEMRRPGGPYPAACNGHAPEQVAPLFQERLPAHSLS